MLGQAGPDCNRHTGDDRVRLCMRPWLMWGVPSFIFLIAFFHRVAPGTVAKELMAAFQGGGALVGLLSSLYFYAYAGLMLPAGLLAGLILAFLILGLRYVISLSRQDE